MAKSLQSFRVDGFEVRRASSKFGNRGKPQGSKTRPALQELALHQVAKKLFDLGSFARVFFLGNRARLATQLQAENLVFE
jgi:hypothetical protein